MRQAADDDCEDRLDEIIIEKTLEGDNRFYPGH